MSCTNIVQNEIKKAAQQIVERPFLIQSKTSCFFDLSQLLIALTAESARNAERLFAAPLATS